MLFIKNKGTPGTYTSQYGVYCNSPACSGSNCYNCPSGNICPGYGNAFYSQYPSGKNPNINSNQCI